MKTKTDILLGCLDPFTKAYLACALWSSLDDSGNPLDDNLFLTDFDPDTLETMRDECLSFQVDNAELLSSLEDSQCGHDFWLTRNRQGAGFWDRDLGEIGKKLTEASHKAGERHLYVGDDGKIYQSP